VKPYFSRELVNYSLIEIHNFFCFYYGMNLELTYGNQ
jgi:hypothetical protein